MMALVDKSNHGRCRRWNGKQQQGIRNHGRDQEQAYERAFSGHSRFPASQLGKGDFLLNAKRL
jgi:hypothetical protein